MLGSGGNVTLTDTENIYSGEKNVRPGADPALAGRVFIVTRAREQSAKMTALIESYGAKVIHCPAIEIVAPDSWEALDRAIREFEKYDWVIFTSANAARFFFTRLKENLCSDAGSQFSNKRVCAIGPATRRSIQEAGVAVDLVAEESVAEGVLEAIVGHLGQGESLRGKRVLIPRARASRDLLPAELSKLGAIVDAVETYQTVKPDVDAGRVIALFERRAVDAITFTSPSTILNFAALVSPHDLRELIGDAVVGCIGPVTAAKAREFGLDSVVQPESYTAESLIEAMTIRLKEAYDAMMRGETVPLKKRDGDICK